MCPSKCASFRQTQKEPDSHDTLRVTHRSGDHRKSTPEKHHSRKEISRSDVGHGQVGGNLADNVTNGEDGVDDIELVAMKGKLLLHAGHIRIGQIGAIEVVEEVGDAAEGEDKEVDLV